MNSTGTIQGGFKIGLPPKPQAEAQERTQAVDQAFQELKQRTEVIRSQAREIVEGEKARQDKERADLFQLFDAVG